MDTRLSLREKCLRALIRWVGTWRLRRAHQVGTLVGLILALTPNKLKKIAQRNIALCLPEHDKKWQQALVKQSLIELGKGLVEAPGFWYHDIATLQGFTRHIHGLEEVEKAFAMGRGVIVLGAHMGAFEYINPALSDKFPTNWIYRPQRNALEDLIHQQRQRTGSTFIPANIQGVQKLYQALKRGEVVGMACDHDPGPVGGIYVPFFGIDTWTMNLAPRLAKVKHSPVFFVFAERLKKARGFDIHFFPLSESIYSEDESEAVRAVNESLEQAARRFSSQYEWHYKRFRRRPPGSASLYDF